jgi:anaerobic C4-dicarboxylate transporter
MHRPTARPKADRSLTTPRAEANTLTARTAINFDLSGTTRIGKYVLNHSFMMPGLVATSVAVLAGLALARIVF